MTGLSGSGKSTLAVGVDAWLQQKGRHCYLLDGDNLRHGLCEDLGFSEEDRGENIRRAGQAARLIAESGIIAICALISPFAAQRERIRETCQKTGIPFAEVFISTPLSVCEDRDPKGLYLRARKGEIPMFTGIDSPYEAPANPDVVLATHKKSAETCVEELGNWVIGLTEEAVEA